MVILGIINMNSSDRHRGKRSYLSGNDKRLLEREKKRKVDEVMSKTPKMTDFLKRANSPSPFLAENGASEILPLSIDDVTVSEITNTTSNLNTNKIVTEVVSTSVQPHDNTKEIILSTNLDASNDQTKNSQEKNFKEDTYEKSETLIENNILVETVHEQSGSAVGFKIVRKIFYFPIRL